MPSILNQLLRVVRRAVVAAPVLMVTLVAMPVSAAEGTPAAKATQKSAAHKAGHAKASQHKAAVRHAAPHKAAPHKNSPRKGGVRHASGGSNALALQSRAALVLDADTGEVLYGKNQNDTVSIASITKLMTAMIVLDAHQDMDEVLTVTNDDIDRIKNSSSRLNVGSQLSRRDMMLIALMSSENRAASVLARNYPGGFGEAVKAMNRKAESLGMTDSRFVDGTGLQPENRASLRDLAKMVKAAAGYDTIHQLSTTEYAFMPVKGYRQKLKYQNSNPLVASSNWDIGVTKTGYIQEAGHCLVMEARLAQRNTILVLMDSWGKYSRVGDASRVRSWIESSRVAAK